MLCWAAASSVSTSSRAGETSHARGDAAPKPEATTPLTAVRTSSSREARSSEVARSSTRIHKTLRATTKAPSGAA